MKWPWTGQRHLTALAGAWQALAPRDRRALMALGWVLLGCMIYLAAWAPSYRHWQTARQHLRDEQALVAQMRAAAPHLRPLLAASSNGLHRLVQREMTRAALKPDHFQQADTGQLNVDFTRVRFADLISCLRTLQRQGVQLQQAQFTRVAEGMVSARLVLGTVHR